MTRGMEARAETAAQRQSERVAAAIAATVPGGRTEVTRHGVIIEGRGLRRRPELRWIAGLVR